MGEYTKYRNRSHLILEDNIAIDLLGSGVWNGSICFQIGMDGKFLNEAINFVAFSKLGKFLEQLNAYQLLKEDSDIPRFFCNRVVFITARRHLP